MDFITILGLLAACLTTFSFIPQMIKTWKSKSAKDVSYVMLITFNIGHFFMVNLRYISTSLADYSGERGVTLFFNIIILWLKIRYR
jgi:MtN3 and saliva related transmembrane protein